MSCSTRLLGGRASGAVALYLAAERLLDRVCKRYRPIRATIASPRSRMRPSVFALHRQPLRRVGNDIVQAVREGMSEDEAQMIAGFLNTARSPQFGALVKSLHATYFMLHCTDSMVMIRLEPMPHEKRNAPGLEADTRDQSGTRIGKSIGSRLPAKSWPAPSRHPGL